MGEYAQIEIWAQQHGKTTSDLEPEEWIQAYEDIDKEEEQRLNRLAKRKCPKCGKCLRNPRGLRQHMRDKHNA